ncbi:hypothetical protein EET67_04900 [Pseudaminobacter arsenicus]|uniref:Restriction alleviation protein, Lar family n=1 Tax=Borborobacter arsenicus TaxID=1851146 RepID=A0A432V9X2_9HYPH|nr:Lar family restriction alleviation protein [Pseudaminobacter arsenicus]RUM98982.1 hypothetical protein EET67_04900 [Pseudaminobacter arsenicus]
MQVTDKMVEALLPCPFCGGKATHRAHWSDDHCVECDVCAGHTTAFSGASEAIEAWNRRAALAHREAEAVAVKPLEWRKGYCDDKVIIHQAGGGWLYQGRVLNGVIWLDWPDKPATEFADEETAKAAAQADYEHRIRSALVAPPAQEPVAWKDATGKELHKIILDYQKQDMIVSGGRPCERAFNYSIPLYAAPPAVPSGMVLVPVEPTAAWVSWTAEIRQGESETPRCEPPSEFDKQVAREWIKRILRAASFLTAAQEGR